jgi:hypothetical protein
MWHPRQWEQNEQNQWVSHRRQDWRLTPSTQDGPSADADDLDALNFMGARGWELAHVENGWDFPQASGGRIRAALRFGSTCSRKHIGIRKPGSCRVAG